MNNDKDCRAGVAACCSNSGSIVIGCFERNIRLAHLSPPFHPPVLVQIPLFHCATYFLAERSCLTTIIVVVVVDVDIVLVVVDVVDAVAVSKEISG